MALYFEYVPLAQRMGDAKSIDYMLGIPTIPGKNAYGHHCAENVVERYKISRA